MNARLAEIARRRGQETEAAELEAKSRRVYQPPEIDPADEKAFTEALASGDMERATEAIKKMWGA